MKIKSRTIITHNEMKNIKTSLVQTNKANVEPQVDLTWELYDDGWSSRATRVLMETTTNYKYEKERSSQIKEIKKLIRQNQVVTYYNGFIVVGNKSFNGFTREMVESLLG